MLPLKVESWVWYSFAVGLILTRLISRALLFGTIKKLQPDDWLMVFVLAPYTAFIVTINIVANENSNLLPPGFDISTLTPQDIKDREYGSKMTLVVEQCQCVTIWTIKACLLLMYYRLTLALKENIIVKGLAVYVGGGFALMEILYFGVWCRPFSDYWAVPTPNTQCSAATNHLITNAVFNVSSDLIMLIMALQMIVRTSLPWRRKVILCAIFSLAVFSILSAVLNKYYSFTEPFGLEWTYWYVRESSTAILVANLPFTWTLLRRLFKLAAFDPNVYASPDQHLYHSHRTAGGRRNHPIVVGQRLHSRHHDETRAGNKNGSVVGTAIRADKSHGHRGGGRSAMTSPVEDLPPKTPKPARTSRESDAKSWFEESLSSKSEKASGQENSRGMQVIEPLATACSVPERMV